MRPESLNRPDLNAEALARITAAAKAASRATAPSKFGGPVPVVYRGGVVKYEWYRQFTFRERVAIFFGCNLVVMIGVACQHSAGKTQPLIMGRVSKSKTATDHMRAVCENILEEKAPPSPIEHEPADRAARGVEGKAKA